MIFKVSNNCSQAGDLCHHSHHYPCLPQKLCLPQNRRRRPSPVSTRMNTLCIPVSTVLFTMMYVLGAPICVSEQYFLHSPTFASAEKRCPSAQCKALSRPLSPFLQMGRRYSTVNRCLLGGFDFGGCSVSQSCPGFTKHSIVFITTQSDRHIYSLHPPR